MTIFVVSAVFIENNCLHRPGEDACRACEPLTGADDVARLQKSNALTSHLVSWCSTASLPWNVRCLQDERARVTTIFLGKSVGLFLVTIYRYLLYLMMPDDPTERVRNEFPSCAKLIVIINIIF